MLVLASASPRRRELLASIGLFPDVRAVDLDETRHPEEPALQYAERVAREKAVAAPRAPGDVVLAADTVVFVGELVLGKPANHADAAWMLRQLSGRAHTVATAVAVLDDNGLESVVATTLVEVAHLDDTTIAAYVATGEPLDKAGAYAVQGHFAAWVERLDGTWSNVVGLPLPVVRRLLEARGFALLAGPSPSGASRT